MTLSQLENFYLKHEEPHLSCFLALKEIILSYNSDISSTWKYGMPFFSYRNKMFCYLWFHKKLKQAYVGIINGNLIEHPDLIQEKRSKIKIILFDSNEDLPIEKIHEILQRSIEIHNNKK